MYNHLSSVINFLQDILCIFRKPRERKTNYIFNMIWNNTDIKHDACCPNNLFQICCHNIKQDCYHAWYVLLKQHCSRLLVHQPETVLFEQTWTKHCWQHCSRLLTTCNRLLRFYACKWIAQSFLMYSCKNIEARMPDPFLLFLRSAIFLLPVQYSLRVWE